MPNTINILRFFIGLCSSILLQISSISFEYSIKAWKSLNCFKPVLSLLIRNYYFALWKPLEYKWILSISGWLHTRLNNEFVFWNPETHIINILYGWSGICSQFELCSFMVFFVTSSKLIIFCIALLYCYTKFFFLRY